MSMSPRQLSLVPMEKQTNKMIENNKDLKQVHFFDLIWEDILIARVLPHISLEDCINFRCTSKTSLQIVYLYLSSIQTLKLIKKCSSETFKVFASSCTRLKILDLTKCHNLMDRDTIPLIKRNRNIVNLNLSWCEGLTALSLQPIILNCLNLKVLKLSKCTWLTIGAVEVLSLHHNLLEEVDFSYCSSISDICIQVFIKKFRFLKILSLEGNAQVTDKSLYAMATFSTSLRLLNLVGCRDISDKGIRALAANCRTLEGLLVRGCVKVTESSLTHIRPRVKVDRRPAASLPVPIFLQV